MLVLGIETSTTRASIALADDRGPVAAASLSVPRRHSEFLAPAIEFALAQSGRTVEDITAVAVGIGPGLFTGLRVGLATAGTLAAARKVPVVGISGLDVLAFQHRHSTRLIAATVDARRGEVFVAVYRPTPGGVEQVTEPRVGRPDDVAAELSGQEGPVLVVGDGVPVLMGHLGSSPHLHVGSSTPPEAADLVDLAMPRVVREETISPHDLAPMYLRVPDAKIGWAARGSLEGGT